MVRAEKAVLIFDEIYTGFCRTGKWFAFEHYGVVPDLICLGKGMSNGFPISACAGSPQMFGAWGPSTGESKHTSTFLGHPIGCAMTSASIRELKKENWSRRVDEAGAYLRGRLELLVQKYPAQIQGVRGRGLMQGLVFKKPGAAGHLMKKLLKRGILILPSGGNSEVLSFSPPFTITRAEIDHTILQLQKAL